VFHLLIMQEYYVKACGEDEALIQHEFVKVDMIVLIPVQRCCLWFKMLAWVS